MWRRPVNGPAVQLALSLDEARALHAALEGLLEGGARDPRLERTYRLLGWRILAAGSGTGLTGQIANLARETGSLEEYEAARERMLGPVLEALERPEYRDP
jgi:hypothetical protein